MMSCLLKCYLGPYHRASSLGGVSEVRSLLPMEQPLIAPEIASSDPSTVAALALSSGRFVAVRRDHQEYAAVEKIFHSVLVPLYGDQTQALTKIAAGVDRVCELFVKKGTPIGILVYKKHPVQDFSTLGVKNALEIKTLFVIDSLLNSGLGIGSRLLERVLLVAKRERARNVVVSVSERKPESLHFFKKKGFSMVLIIHGQFLPDVDEYVLAKQL